MNILRAYRTELDPNNVQITALRQHCGAARYAFNWALSRVNAGISKPNAVQLHRELNAIKREFVPLDV